MLFLASTLLFASTVHARGCGSHGGPGWRKADGHCASWADGKNPHSIKHKKHKRK